MPTTMRVGRVARGHLAQRVEPAQKLAGARLPVVRVLEEADHLHAFFRMLLDMAAQYCPESGLPPTSSNRSPPITSQGIGAEEKAPGENQADSASTLPGTITCSGMRRLLST